MANANHMGVGDRPSESHNWVPGYGWVFMPSFKEGESFAQQSAAREDPTAGWLPKLSEQSLADAKKSGSTAYYVGHGSSIPSDIAENIRARQASHDWYTGGMDHYNGPVDNGHEWKAAAGQWVNDRNGKPTVSPWTHTFDHDAKNTFERMRMDNYNPFLGKEGGWVGEDATVSGVSEGYLDDSISAYLKNAFSGEDQIHNRYNALGAFKGWNSQVRNPNYQSNMDSSEKWMDGKGRGINAATTRMNKQYFDEMGLGEFGLTYQEALEGSQDPVHSNSDDTGVTPTGMMSSSWLDVMQDGVTAFNEKWNANRRGAPAVAGMLGGLTGGPGVAPRPNNNPIQEEWGKLPNEGMMKRSGPDRDLVYSKLMEKLGG